MKIWVKGVVVWFAVMGAGYGICYLINPDVARLAPVTWGTLVMAFIVAGVWAAMAYWGSPHSR